MPLLSLLLLELFELLLQFFRRGVIAAPGSIRIRFPCSGSHLGQCRAHRRLAHAALAGDDENVALCAEGPHVHAGPSVVAGPRLQIDRRPKILVTPLESDHPRR